MLLNADPELLELFRGQRFQVIQRLHGPKTPLKLTIRVAQQARSVKALFACQVNQSEQQIAQLFGFLRRADRSVVFSDLFVNLVTYPARIGPIASGSCGATTERLQPNEVFCDT